MSDLKYAGDVVLLAETASLNFEVGLFGMCFSPPKCELLLQDWVDSARNLALAEGQLGELDKFNYSGSFISPGDRILNEVSSRIQNTRLGFTDLRYLWLRHDTGLSDKSWACISAVWSVLLCGSENVAIEGRRCAMTFDARTPFSS